MRKKFTTSGKSYGIVLGKRLTDEGEGTHELEERICKATELYFSGKIDRIIVSGGQANRSAPCAESAVMRELLVAHGVSPEDVTEENSSLNTLQNAAYCKKLLKNEPFSELFLITSSYHMFRRYFNPVRIFRYVYRLPVKPVYCYDCNVTRHGRGGKTRLVIHNGTADEKRYAEEGCTVIFKDVNVPVRYGKETRLLKKDELEEFVAEIEKIYGKTEICFSEEDYD